MCIACMQKRVIHVFARVCYPCVLVMCRCGCGRIFFRDVFCSRCVFHGAFFMTTHAGCFMRGFFFQRMVNGGRGAIQIP